jgi:hypothetical protein
MTRALTLIAIVAMALGLLAPVAMAQNAVYPPQSERAANPTVIVTTPGAIVRIEGRNWGPDSRVQIIQRDAPNASSTAAASDERVLSSVTTSSDGTWEADVTVPADVEPGTLNLVARPDTSENGGEVTAADEQVIALTVEDAVASAAPADIDAAPAVSFLTPTSTTLVALILLGGLALFLGPIRRRRSTTV